MPSSLSEFVRQYPLKSFRRNETIFFQDDQPATTYYIKSGFVKGYDIDSQGNEQLLFIGTVGDFFPLASVFATDPTVPYFLTAFSDVEAYAIRQSDFRRFLDDNHDALREVTNVLARRLANTYHHLNAAAKARADEKLVHGLYFLARNFDDTQSQAGPQVTQQDIASLIGLTRETVSQELKKLKDQGLVDYNKYRFIINQEKLKARLAGEALL